MPFTRSGASSGGDDDTGIDESTSQPRESIPPGSRILSQSDITSLIQAALAADRATRNEPSTPTHPYPSGRIAINFSNIEHLDKDATLHSFLAWRHAPCVCECRIAADVAGNPESKKNEAESADANPVDYLSTLPARQRQLYLRIQQQQREPSSIAGDAAHPEDEKAADDKWYSSDEEDNGGGKSDLSKSTRNAAESSAVKDSSGSVSVGDLNLSSLENINVAEIAKVLSTLKQDTASSTPEDTPPADGGRRDPRMRDPRMRLQPQPSNMGDVDHRVPPVRQDVDLRVSNNRISSGDTDLRSGLAPLSSNLDEIGSSDIDLRRLPLLPFKPVVAPAYSSSAAMEIEASHDSHPPIEYIVYVVDYIPLDYSQIRVHADWSHLDPRQQKSHVTVRDFTSSDPPSIPLSGNFSGPVSPDPPAPSPRQYDPPEAAPYPAVRSAPNDPRARDPRRAAAAERQASSPGGSIPDPRGKPGLLGAAPPGMVPLKGKTDVVLPVENRRDPRQRLRTLAAGITQSPQRSYTPPSSFYRLI